MKKIYIILSVLTMACIFSACSVTVDESYVSTGIEKVTINEEIQTEYDNEEIPIEYVLSAYIEYSPAGNMRVKMEYEYDNEGNIISSIMYNGNGEKIWTYKYVEEDDLSGNKIKKIYCYYPDGKELSGWEEHMYDNEEREIKTRSYGSDGDLDYYYDYEYDEYGQLIHSVRHGAAEIDFDYEYDDNGYCIRKYMNSAHGGMTHCYEYEYNEYGEVIKETIYRASGEIDGWTEYQYTELKVSY